VLLYTVNIKNGQIKIAGVVNLEYDIYYTGTDTCNYVLLLLECYYFCSKPILIIQKILHLSRKTSSPCF